MKERTEANPSGWTYSEYARLPDDGNRYEVLDGEVLVTPAPSPHHQQVVFRLQVRLHEYLRRGEAGWVFHDVDVLFASGQFLRPDLVVVPFDAREGITDRGIEVPPILVVEVLSPSSRTIDRVRKPRRYLELGVPTYWVVDPTEEEIWVWNKEGGPDAPRKEADTVRWSHPGAAEPLKVAVEDLVKPL